LPQPKLGFLCQFHSPRIEREAKANGLKDVALAARYSVTGAQIAKGSLGGVHAMSPV
jgi:hypothetical protein